MGPTVPQEWDKAYGTNFEREYMVGRHEDGCKKRTYGTPSTPKRESGKPPGLAAVDHSGDLDGELDGDSDAENLPNQRSAAIANLKFAPPVTPNRLRASKALLRVREADLQPDVWRQPPSWRYAFVKPRLSLRERAALHAVGRTEAAVAVPPDRPPCPKGVATTWRGPAVPPECSVCTGTLSRPGNQLVVCDGCGDLYHQTCHAPPITADALQQPAWHCAACVGAAGAAVADRDGLLKVSPLATAAVAAAANPTVDAYVTAESMLETEDYDGSGASALSSLPSPSIGGGYVAPSALTSAPWGSAAEPTAHTGDLGRMLNGGCGGPPPLSAGPPRWHYTPMFTNVDTFRPDDLLDVHNEASHELPTALAKVPGAAVKCTGALDLLLPEVVTVRFHENQLIFSDAVHHGRIGAVQ